MNDRCRLIIRVGFGITCKTSWYKELRKQDLEISQRLIKHVSWRKRARLEKQMEKQMDRDRRRYGDYIG